MSLFFIRKLFFPAFGIDTLAVSIYTIMDWESPSSGLPVFGRAERRGPASDNLLRRHNTNETL